MKHSVATQGSNVYDAKTHDRLNKAAFDWCASFAAKFEANHDDDEEQEEQEQEQEEQGHEQSSTMEGMLT